MIKLSVEGSTQKQKIYIFVTNGTKHLVNQALLLSTYQSWKSCLPYYLCCVLCNVSRVLSTCKTPRLQGSVQVPTSVATLSANYPSKHLRNIIIPLFTTDSIDTPIRLVRLVCYLEFRLFKGRDYEILIRSPTLVISLSLFCWVMRGEKRKLGGNPPRSKGLLNPNSVCTWGKEK